MISLAEFLLTFALLVTFFGYAVWKSPAVRVFGWCLLAGTLANALLPDRPLAIAACVAAACAVSVFVERRETVTPR